MYDLAKEWTLDKESVRRPETAMIIIDASQQTHSPSYLNFIMFPHGPYVYLRKGAVLHRSDERRWAMVELVRSHACIGQSCGHTASRALELQLFFSREISSHLIVLSHAWGS